MKTQITLYFVLILISLSFKGNAVIEYKSSEEIQQARVEQEAKTWTNSSETKTSLFKKRDKKKFRIDWFKKRATEKEDEKVNYILAWLGLSFSSASAILTLALIILSLGPMFWIPILLAGAGLTLSIIALRRSILLGASKGRGLALGGLITGGIVLAFWLFLFITVIVILGIIF